MTYEFKGLGALGALGELQFKDRRDIRGHRDYSPDKGNTSFHFRDCVLKVDAAGAYGAFWDCQRVDHKQITVQKGYNPPLPEGDDPERNCKLKSTTPAGTKYFDCPRWVVDAVIPEANLEHYKARCLVEGIQGHPEKRLQAERKPAAGSAVGRFLLYPGVPLPPDHLLRCRFDVPIPSKDRAFKEAVYRREQAAGKRFLTEAEKEQYSSLCEPYVTSTGAEIPRKLSWRKESDYIGTTLRLTDIKEGDDILVCVPDLAGVKLQIDHQLSRLNRERAWAAASQQSPEEQQRLADRQEELQLILSEGEEPATPFYVRYKVPLIMVGAMLVLGGGAALVQRVVKKRKRLAGTTERPQG